MCARIGIADDERTLFQRCVAPLFVTDPTWRSPPDALARGAGGAPVLWSNGISGDRPIVLLHVAERGDAVAQVLRAQRFWQAMGVGVDVVAVERRGGVRRGRRSRQRSMRRSPSSASTSCRTPTARVRKYSSSPVAT